MGGPCAQSCDLASSRRLVSRWKGSLDLVQPRQKQAGDYLRLLDQRAAGEDQRRQFRFVAIDLDVISNLLGIADEIDGRRTGVENIERRPGGDACEESPLKPQLFKLWQTAIEQRLDPTLPLGVGRLEGGEALLPLRSPLHRFFQLGDDRFDASLLEHRIEMRFGLYAVRPNNDACECAKIGETAALFCRCCASAVELRLDPVDSTEHRQIAVDDSPGVNEASSAVARAPQRYRVVSGRRDREGRIWKIALGAGGVAAMELSPVGFAQDVSVVVRRGDAVSLHDVVAAVDEIHEH